MDAPTHSPTTSTAIPFIVRLLSKRDAMVSERQRPAECCERTHRVRDILHRAEIPPLRKRLVPLRVRHVLIRADALELVRDVLVRHLWELAHLPRVSVAAMRVPEFLFPILLANRDARRPVPTPFRDRRQRDFLHEIA